MIALERVRRLQSLQSNGGVNADILRPSSPLLVGEEYGLELEDAAVVRFWVTDEIPTVRVSLTLQLEEIVASEPRRLTSAECYEAPLTERTYSHAVKLTLHAGRDVPLIMVATTHDATSDTELEETTGSLDALPADRRRAVALFPATDRRRALPTGRGHRLRRALAVRPNRLLCGRRASHPRHRGRRLRSELAADCAD